MRRALRLLASSTFLLLLAAGSLRAQEYGVQAGDRVTIDFFTAAGEAIDEIAGERTVDREGNMFLPYVGTVEVAGLDAVGIRVKLERLYVDVFPGAVVEVSAALRVSVTGAVGRAGVFYLDPSTTAVQALSEAGGGQDRAGSQNTRLTPNYSAVRLVRGDEVRTLDLDPDGPNREDLSMRIQSGDWYYVPTASSARSLRDNISFWSQLATLALTVVVLVNAVGGN